MARRTTTDGANNSTEPTATDETSVQTEPGTTVVPDVTEDGNPTPTEPLAEPTPTEPETATPTPTEPTPERVRNIANAYAMQLAVDGFLTFKDGEPGFKMSHVVNVGTHEGEPATGTVGTFVPLASLVGLTGNGIERVRVAHDPERKAKEAIADLLKKGYKLDDLINFGKSVGLQ